MPSSSQISCMKYPEVNGQFNIYSFIASASRIYNSLSGKYKERVHSAADIGCFGGVSLSKDMKKAFYFCVWLHATELATKLQTVRQCP